MADDLRLRVILDLADRALAPLKRLSQGGKGLADQLRVARGELRQLEAQQQAIGQFRALGQQFRASAANAQVLRQKLAALRAQTPANATEAKALATQIGATERALHKANTTVDQQSQKLAGLRERMRALGIRNVAAEEATLGQRIGATNQRLDERRNKLAALNKLNAQYGRTAMKVGAAVGTGYAMRTAGSTLVQTAATPLAQGRKYANEILQIQSLGLDDAATKGAIRYAEAMKTYGTSTVDNLGLMKDALTAFADTHHAEMVMPLLTKMKFANEAVYGADKGADNDKKFMDMLKVIEMRGGLANQQAFEKQANIVQQVLTATGGRVGPEEWLNVIKTGGLAAKGINDAAFYYQLEPLVQEMGGHRVGTSLMSAYQNVYQGKTTKRSALMLDELGLIADKTKVKHDKVGQISQLGVGAIKGSELFQTDQFAWMEQVLLPALAAKGKTSDKDVLDAMGGIFSNRNAANLFATMYQQRDQIHKNARLNAGAANVDALYNLAKGSSAGAELDLLKKRDDLYQRLSTAAMPAYVAALEAATGAIERMNRFAQANPGLTKAMAVGFGALAVSMLAIGTVLIPLALVVGKFMLLRYVLARLSITLPVFGLLGRGMALLGRLGTSAFGLLARGAAALAPVLMAVGKAALAFLFTPMGAALALLAVAAVLVWKNWDGIKGGLAIVWQQIQSGAQSLWQSISDAGTRAWQFLVGLKTQFMSAGTALMQGLASGITGGLAAVREGIFSAGERVVGWFKEKLGIKSPSRVFMALGEFIPAGAALGIERGSPRLQAAALAMAALPALSMPTLARADAEAPAARALVLQAPAERPRPSAEALPPLRPPRAPPQGAEGTGGGTGAGYSFNAGPITITINAAPGQDPQAIARAVSAELDRRARRRGADVRAQLSDID